MSEGYYYEYDDYWTQFVVFSEKNCMNMVATWQAIRPCQLAKKKWDLPAEHCKIVILVEQFSDVLKGKTAIKVDFQRKWHTGDFFTVVFHIWVRSKLKDMGMQRTTAEPGNRPSAIQQKTEDSSSSFYFLKNLTFSLSRSRFLTLFDDDVKVNNVANKTEPVTSDASMGISLPKQSLSITFSQCQPMPVYAS